MSPRPRLPARRLTARQAELDDRGYRLRLSAQTNVDTSEEVIDLAHAAVRRSQQRLDRALAALRRSADRAGRKQAEIDQETTSSRRQNDDG